MKQRRKIRDKILSIALTVAMVAGTISGSSIMAKAAENDPEFKAVTEDWTLDSDSGAFAGIFPDFH